MEELKGIRELTEEINSRLESMMPQPQNSEGVVLNVREVIGLARKRSFLIQQLLLDSRASEVRMRKAVKSLNRMGIPIDEDALRFLDRRNS